MRGLLSQIILNIIENNVRLQKVMAMINKIF
jgi:hypothetical protein